VRAGRAHLLGARDDVAQILPALDVFALSSHWEGEPIALLEALATALGCVASATFGAQEILQGGALGQLVPIADVRAMAAALRALLADRARCEAYGQAGRAAMEQRSYAAQAARMRALYMELLTR
jgi:glycosyltransferase involved in cell wall biosynthesis